MKNPISRLLSLLLVLGIVLSGPAQAAELSAQEQGDTSVSAAALSEEDASEQDALNAGADASASPGDASDADRDPADTCAGEALGSDCSAAPSSADSTPADESSSADSVPSDGSSDADTAHESSDADRDPADAPSDSGPDPAASVASQSAEDASVSSEDDGPIAQHLTARSADDLSDILADQWRDDYFQEAVVDTRRNRVEVDGQRASVKDAFGSEADSGEILDSPEAAEAYFEETPYETEVDKHGLVHVTDPWQARRIVVEAKSLPEDYGAELVIRDVKYNRIILQFPDQASTEAAYEALSGRYPCFADQILFADDLLQETETWGKEYMHFQTLFSSAAANAAFDNAGTIQVAVIDSGCQNSNPFFHGRAFSAESKSIVDDGSPYVDTNGSHGTHVAGIVHACTPANVELMILRIYKDATTSLSIADTAVKYAVEHGAEVINFSSAQFADNAANLTAMDDGLALARSKGVPVVCAAGNKSQDVSKSYPACEADAVAVSAINRNGEFAATYSSSPSWSNLGTGSTGSAYGSGIDFCAPGVDVLSAVGDSTGTKNGTSMAAPHITAAFACLRLLNPDSDYYQLYDQLKSICVDLKKRGSDEDYYPGRDDYYGWGCPDLSELIAGHVHQWNVKDEVPPTCTEQGYTVYKCAQCDEERTGNYRAPAHHFGEDGTCTACGKPLVENCGEGVTWSYDNASYTLTITGSGSVTTAAWELLYTKEYIRRLVLNGVTGLSDNLFQNYPYLKSVDFGDKLASLGAGCFAGCSALTQISLPASLSSFGEGALSRCTSLTSLTCESDLFAVSGDTLLLGQSGQRLLLCAAGRSGTSLTVPELVRSISPSALDGLSKLTRVILPTTLTSLEENTFAGCIKLSKIYARSNVETLGDNCFNGLTATLYVSEGCTGWEDSGNQGGTITRKSYPGNMGDPNQWTMALNALTWTYTGQTRRPGIKLTHGQEEDADYKCFHNFTLDGEAANHSGYFSYVYTNNVLPAHSTDANAPTATVTGKGIYFGTQSLTFNIYLATPALQSAVSGLQGVDLSWESVLGAVKYQILRKEGDGAWIVLKGAVTTDTHYTDTTAEAGKTYSYSLYAMDESGENKSRYNGTGKSVYYLPAPVLESAKTQENSQVLVRWTGSDAAVKYLLLRQDNDGAWAQIAETTSTSALDPNPTLGVDNCYSVQAVAADGTVSAVPAGLSVRCLSAPVLTGGACEENGIRLSWNASAGAVRYQVSCKTDGNWSTVGNTTDTTLLVTTSDGRTALRDGVTYQFSVRCVSADGSSYNSVRSEALSATYQVGPVPDAPVVVQTGVQLSWSSRSQAASYVVEHKNAKGVWQTLKGTQALRAIDTSPLVGTNTYRVRFRTAAGTLSASGAEVSVVCCAKPALSSIANEGAGVRLSWKASAGAKRYRVLCQQKNGSWKKVLDTTKTTALAKTTNGKSALVTGKTYRFAVCCLSADGKLLASGWNNGKALVFVRGTALTKVQNLQRQTLSLRWSRVSGVSGYQVQIARNAAFTAGKKTLNVSGQKSVSASFRALKKGTYRVRLRCYRTVSGKAKWSGWSSVRKIVIRK